MCRKVQKRGLLVTTILIILLLLFSLSSIAISNRGKSYKSQWNSLTTNQNVDVTIDVTEIAITQVQFTNNKPVSNANLVITNLRSTPDLSRSISEEVFMYFDTTTEKLSDISDLRIHFKVPVSWLEQRGINEDNIVLYHYYGGWNELMTAKKSADDSYLHYYAAASGFGYFAISTKLNPQNYDMQQYIDDFYSGKSSYTAFDIIDLTREYYEAQ